MRQTWALLIDAYRDLNSRKLFWIVLILSTLVAASFFAVGIDDRGASIFGHVFFPDYNTHFVKRSEFYKEVFVGYGIDTWLSLVAIALALISTASIFPEFLAGGAVDLYLAKPISRIRLFLTKYFCGLLFVAMQIFCFCLTCFLVIGIRGGEWLPGVFLAVPIVLLFYSYLFAICVFWGVWTRSTIAALLLTILCWFLIFGIHFAEVAMLRMQYSDDVRAKQLDDRIVRETAILKQVDKQMAEKPNPDTTQPTTRAAMAFWKTLFPGPDNENVDPRVRLRERTYTQLTSDQAERQQFTGTIIFWHKAFYLVMTALPKTSETVELLTRVLVKNTGMEGSDATRQSDDTSDDNRVQLEDQAQQMFLKELNSRSVSWVAGTSVAFECVVMTIAAWMFCRRDY
jgi:hypothetical protein